MRFVGRRITADGLPSAFGRARSKSHPAPGFTNTTKIGWCATLKVTRSRAVRSGTRKRMCCIRWILTHPGAQEYLRQTYKTLVREWGVRFIKLDFMDTTAIEGFRYRPETTALEAQRIGLQIIRDAVGDDVVLDKDGSPMLTPSASLTPAVFPPTRRTLFVDAGCRSGDRCPFYMHRNFFLNDPDAFNTTAQAFPDIPELPSSLSLSAAQASIALSAVSGGMYEIGDDMIVLGSQKDRLALVENTDLLNMAKIGRASTRSTS